MPRFSSKFPLISSILDFRREMLTVKSILNSSLWAKNKIRFFLIFPHALRKKNKDSLRSPKINYSRSDFFYTPLTSPVQSTSGSYTKASSSVRRVSRFDRSTRRTVSQAILKHPLMKVNIVVITTNSKKKKIKKDLPSVSLVHTNTSRAFKKKL